jgi:hypothetical protein
MRERIDNQDYEAVFAHGGCYHFALRLNERRGYGYAIHGNSPTDNSTSWSHVWAVKDGYGIDIRGVYLEELTNKMANGGVQFPIEVISPEQVRSVITKRGFPKELDDELFSLADWIVDKHERFELARPPGLGFPALKKLLDDQFDKR